MTAPVYRRIYRRVDLSGSVRVARSRGVPDIPIGKVSTGAPADVVTRIRGRSFGVTGAPTGRDAVVYSVENALLFPTSWSDYGGIIPGSTLTRYPASGEGDYTVPTGAANSVPAVVDGVATGSTGTGTPVENMNIFGVARQAALPFVWYKNCRFNGTLATGAATGAVEASSLNFRGALIQDSEILVRNNNTWHTGIRGSNVTVKRTEISGAADGITWNATGGNARYLGVWAHNGAYDEWASGDTAYLPQGSNYLHCDGAQAGQGANLYAKGCYIGGSKTGAWLHHDGHKADILAGDDFYNSAVLLAQAPVQQDGNQYLITGKVEQCVLFGGTATVNVATSNGYDLSGFEFKDNIFPKWTGGQWYILKPANCNCIFTNNRHPDGTLVPIVAG